MFDFDSLPDGLPFEYYVGELCDVFQEMLNSNSE